ncbi:MAG: Por secretion system protein [Prevotella sp.]|nr:Por secretion system protein [Prevotella sp.]
MKKFIILFVLTILNCPFSIGQIGKWKTYMAYHDVQEIEKAGDELFVMASNDLYQYNLNDESIYTYDKTNGLSDTFIRHIKWCPDAKRLIVVYQNSNIDLVETNGNVINISDLYTKIITGDKTVKSIRIDGVYAYLICEFGIVKVNMERAEISDSYTPNHPEYPTNLPEEDNSAYDQYIEVVKKLNPGGPKYNYFFNMLMHKGKLYTVGGGIYQFNTYNRPGCIQILENNQWTIYQDDIKPAFANSYKDVTSITIDPLHEDHVVVTSCSGLYEFMNGTFKYNYTDGNNEYIKSATTDNNPNYVFTNGAIYDQEGNLFFLNSEAPKAAIIKWSKDGKWSGIINPEIIDINNRSLRMMKGSMIDSRGLLWFANAHSDNPALLCYDDDNNSITKFNNFKNQDGISLSVVWVECVCEDKEGNIWVGTDKGPFYLTVNEMTDPSLGIIQYKVPRKDDSGYADYLLDGIEITNIAIDGGGRKWFGTSSNGVYLISADNNDQLQHFTMENSPLLSNNIESIAINQQTGEVFFGTDKGLCSYISDATEPTESMDNDNVYAYPNPVDFNNFSGLITITGLTLNADVKITNAAGFLIAEGRSNGGLFTWDGKDKKGNRVASGVYNVITATQEGKKGTVCKIAIIR